MLTPEKIENYKKILKVEKERLLKEINIESRPEDFGNDIDHFDEKTDEAEEFQNQMGIVQTLKDRVNEIDAALNIIETGNYGKCEKCGMEISEKVLNTVPESNLCEHCKKNSVDI